MFRLGARGRGRETSDGKRAVPDVRFCEWCRVRAERRSVLDNSDAPAPPHPRAIDELRILAPDWTMGKRTASAETLKPDPIYRSVLASKFINC
ncbi:MAG TPA: hypothetical protein VKE94_04085, partial [Gemmataceae bacterium]|nr:hypothetical protein [Gemmataceae bacterium]